MSHDWCKSVHLPESYSLRQHLKCDGILKLFKVVVTVIIDLVNFPPKPRGMYGTKGGTSCRWSNGDTGHWMCFERSFRKIYRSRQHCPIRLMDKSLGPALRNISTNETNCSSINMLLIGTCDGNNMAAGHLQWRSSPLNQWLFRT